VIGEISWGFSPILIVKGEIHRFIISEFTIFAVMKDMEQEGKL